MRQGLGIGLVVLVVLAGIAAFGWWMYERARGDGIPEGIIVASGRVEARETRVAAAAGGRVLQVLVEEGDVVQEGDVLVELDRRSVEAGIAAAEAAYAAARANVTATQGRIAALESQADLARTEAERSRRLLARDAVSRQTVDLAESTRAQLENEMEAARAGLDLARRQADAARAEIRAIEVRLSEATVHSPVSGVVQSKLLRQGEMAAPGMTLLRLLERDEVTLRVYLPIASAQRVRPGMEARAYVEGIEGTHVPGAVERLSEEAEFTPRDVHMPDDRTTLVIAASLRFPNLDGLLKNGFPADVFIRWDPAVPWPGRRPWQ